jgi:Na+-driven multidrug efflux pump
VAWERSARTPADQPLSQAFILRFWQPLALSWIFMALESPISTAVLSQLPGRTINTAGLQVLLALSILIESPVIDLLSTSTTLSRSPEAYRVLRRFALIMMALVAVVHGLVAFTPLYDVITLQVLQLEPDVAEATRIPMQIMTLWSALVGWRRFLHGVMIRHGDTRPVTIGTLIRVIAVAIVGFGLVWLAPGMGGLQVAAWSLLASVFSETLFIHFVSRRVVTPLLAGELEDDEAGPAPTLGKVFRFHMPLTASTFLMICTMPLVTFALARLPDPVMSMAAWQVALGFGWLFRSATFALPEVVIALYRRPEREPELRRFCLTAGAVLTGLLVVFALSGLDKIIFVQLMNVEPSVAEAASFALLLSAPMSFFSAQMALSRGLLTAMHATTPRLWAIAGGLSTLAVGLFLCIQLNLPAILSVSLVLIAAISVEASILHVCWVKRRTRAALA